MDCAILPPKKFSFHWKWDIVHMTILFVPQVPHAMQYECGACQRAQTCSVYSVLVLFLVAHDTHVAYIIFASAVMARAARALNCDASDSLGLDCRLLVGTLERFSKIRSICWANTNSIWRQGWLFACIQSVVTFIRSKKKIKFDTHSPNHFCKGQMSPAILKLWVSVTVWLCLHLCASVLVAVVFVLLFQLHGTHSRTLFSVSKPKWWLLNIKCTPLNWLWI